MIEGWKRKSLGILFDFRNGINFTHASRGEKVKVVGVGDFKDNEVLSDFSGTTSVTLKGAVNKDDLLQNEDLLFVRSNGNKALIGRCVLIKGISEPVSFSGFTIRGRANSGEIDHSFASKLVRSQLFKEHLHKMGGGSSISNLSQETLSEFYFYLPPLAEQRKIAEILLTWDEAIEKLEALRAAKGSRLDGLRAGLLFGGLRLNDHHRNWVTHHLSEVTHEMTARNGKMRLGRDAVMGVSNTQGIVPMREQTIAEDIGRYKRLPPRAFAYNPMRINVGSIAMNDGPDEVLVSPDYVVFGCNPEGLDPDYLDHLRKTRWWGHYINSGGSGSVRMRTYYDDLAAMKLPLPELDEQRDIVRVLNAARDEVTKTAKKIDLLTRQKRGLMQKLLTGQWRVAVDEPAIREAMA